MTRDARGRFCTVPDLILDAACREAVRVLRSPSWPAFLSREAAVRELLEHATHTAALLGRAS